MPIQIIWGDDLNASNQFIHKLINQKVSILWKEINVSHLNGDDNNQVIKALEEIITPPLGDGSRVVVLKNNPIFTNKSEEINNRFEKIYKNIPKNNYLILQNIKKPDSRLKSTKVLRNLIKNNFASEVSFTLPDIWDHISLKQYIEKAASIMNIKLDQNVASLILDSVGNDSFTLKTELEKAKIYLTAKNSDKNSQLLLKSEDVKKIFNDHQSNIFKIIDNLLQKNMSQSLIEINYLLQKGEPALRLNAGLISQIRMHTIVLLLSKSGEQDLTKICSLANISLSLIHI